MRILGRHSLQVHFPTLDIVVEEVNCELVSRHHDGGVGDLPDQLSPEAPVEAAPALLLGHQPQRLPEGLVFVPGFAHARSRYLMRISNAGGAGFGRSSAQHVTKEIRNRFLFTDRRIPTLRQTFLERFIDDKVDYGFADSPPGGGHALPETS